MIMAPISSAYCGADDCIRTGDDGDNDGGDDGGNDGGNSSCCWDSSTIMSE